jgi:hypothetical protein
MHRGTRERAIHSLRMTRHLPPPCTVPSYHMRCLGVWPCLPCHHRRHTHRAGPPAHWLCAASTPGHDPLNHHAPCQHVLWAVWDCDTRCHGRCTRHAPHARWQASCATRVHGGNPAAAPNTRSPTLPATMHHASTSCTLSGTVVDVAIVSGFVTRLTRACEPPAL